MDEDFLAEYEDTVERAARALRQISEDDAAQPLRAGGWSAKQLVGHLVDSASNNHGRFVRGGLGADLVFPGYDQDAWVELQRYDQADWQDLVSLFEELNLALCRVVARIPADALTREHTTHNLHEIAFREVAAGEPVTLEWFVRDYLVHLQHHLNALRLDER